MSTGLTVLVVGLVIRRQVPTRQVLSVSCHYQTAGSHSEMSEIRENVLYSKETWEGEGHGPMSCGVISNILVSNILILNIYYLA